MLDCYAGTVKVAVGPKASVVISDLGQQPALSQLAPVACSRYTPTPTRRSTIFFPTSRAQPENALKKVCVVQRQCNTGDTVGFRLGKPSGLSPEGQKLI